VADLDLEMARRRARFRAWKAHGLPVDAVWENLGRGWVRVEIVCTACKVGNEAEDAVPSGACAVAEDLADTEASVLDALMNEDEDEDLRCSGHLAPLLQPDPPEVLAIAELELLAGEGGHHG
jgi:hypothetical protein